MSKRVENLDVKHNAAEHRFEVEVDGHLSVADYEAKGDTMVFTHTYTPPELRGRGIAEQLVRTALDFARDNKRKVVPACSYVDLFIQRHAEYKSLLTQ